MKNKVKLLIIGIPFLSAVTFLSYSVFSNYRPKILTQIEEVRGLKNDRSMMPPYPRGSQKISYDKTYKGEQLTFKTNLSPNEVQTFYQNVLQEKNWILDSKSNEDGFSISRYKREKAFTVISATHEKAQNLTIASIEISQE